MRRLSGEALEDVSPTLGFHINSVRYEVDGARCTLNLWDVGGQPSLRAFWRNYFEKTDGVLWVLDSADTARLREGVLELSSLLSQHAGALALAPLLVLANKQDVPGALSPDTLAQQLKPLCAHVRVHVQGCSATSAEDNGVREGVDWLARDMMNRLYALDTRTVADT